MTRIEGRLVKWNDDRGFGFIEPTRGGVEVFVHVSALPRDGRRPHVGESLLFEVQADTQGRRRAVSVERPQPASAPARAAPRRKSQGVSGRLLLIGAVGLAGYLIYGQIDKHVLQRLNGTANTRSGSSLNVNFRCDGRRHCSEMTSCDEATFFVRNCPDTEMDGDHDGIPCERQWCGS